MHCPDHARGRSAFAVQRLMGGIERKLHAEETIELVGVQVEVWFRVAPWRSSESIARRSPRNFGDTALSRAHRMHVVHGRSQTLCTFRTRGTSTKKVLSDFHLPQVRSEYAPWRVIGYGSRGE